MATNDNIPRDLDWVSARAACTVAQMFNELRTGIENDIAKYTEIMQPPDQERVTAELLAAPQWQFLAPQAELGEKGASIAIGRPKKIPNRRVFVAVVGNEIRVYDDALRPVMSASVGLNKEGRCILRLKDDTVTELEQWQFRKMVLETVLFGDK
jgi:hypothetical protein